VLKAENKGDSKASYADLDGNIEENEYLDQVDPQEDVEIGFEEERNSSDEEVKQQEEEQVTTQ